MRQPARGRARCADDDQGRFHPVPWIGNCLRSPVGRSWWRRCSIATWRPKPRSRIWTTSPPHAGAGVACMARSRAPLVFEFTMHEPYVFEGLTSWQPAMALHGEQAAALYRDPAFRDSVKRELAHRARRMFNGEWDKIFVRQAAHPENAQYEGQRCRNWPPSVACIPWISCSISPGGGSSTPYSRPPCSTPMKRRWAHAVRRARHAVPVRCRRPSDFPAMPGLACISSITGCVTKA